MLRPLTKEHGAAVYARRLLRFLSKHRERLSPMLILTHDYPDPDALASAFGLYYLAQRVFGIEARIVYGGVISRTENRAMVKTLKIPVHKLKRSELKRFKNIALVDTQPKFQNNSFPQNRRAVLVIDQHPSVIKPSADLALIDTECGATCVIVAQALMLRAIDIPVKLATAIAYGILSDTLDLYRANRPDVVQTYLSILHRCDMRALAKIQNPPRSRRFFTTLGRGIQNATAYRRVMVSHLGTVPSPEDVAQVADFLLTYERVNWSFCTGRYKGNLHLSLRTSKSNSQAGEVLRGIVNNPAEAGGHGAIGGGKIKVGKSASEEIWKGLEQTLHSRLAKRLRLPANGEFRKIFSEPSPRRATPPLPPPPAPSAPTPPTPPEDIPPVK